MAGSRTRLPRPPASRPARFSQQADIALTAALADDDQLIAGARVVSGPSPGPMAFVAAGVAGNLTTLAAGLARPAPLAEIWAPAVTGLILAAIQGYIQRPMLIGISRHQLVCVRLTTLRRRPVRVVGMPLSVAAIDRYSRHARTTSITLSMPGTRPLRLHGSGRKRQAQLDYVLERAAAAGVPFRTQRRSARAPAPPLDYGPSLNGLPRWSSWPSD